MLTRIPIFGNFSAKRSMRSSNHPEVEMTTLGDFFISTSTISSKSSRTKGSPPVMLTNLTLGRISNSSGFISRLFSVGLFQMSHILQCIGHR